MPKMTRAQALKAAKTKWGVRAVVRDNGEWLRDGSKRPSNDDERAEARAVRDAVKAREPKFLPLAEWPGETTITEYRTARAAHNAAHVAWSKEWNEARSLCHHGWRYEIGRDIGLGTMIEAHGDSWEEALAKAGVGA